MTEELSVLVLITLAAAVVNGALGHGFSSITVPVALLFYTSRILNPALVLLEVCINTAIVLMSRSSLPRWANGSSRSCSAWFPGLWWARCCCPGSTPSG